MKKLALGLVLIILGTGFALAQTMSDPVRVSTIDPVDGYAWWAQVAMGPKGEAYVVWQENHTTNSGHDIKFRSYNGAKWSDILNLKTRDTLASERPGIACNKQGIIAVVWGQPEGVFLREYDPVQKKWLPVFKVSQSDLSGWEQSVAVDPDGNIYVIWYGRKPIAGRIFSRSRINGIWEETVQMCGPAYSTGCSIAAGQDGRVWAVWREKTSDYYIQYSRRTKSTGWNPKAPIVKQGAGHDHPHITVGPDNVPWVTYAEVPEEGVCYIWLLMLNEKRNPREVVFPPTLQHYSQVAIDASLNRHLTTAVGPGDNGIGIKYTNNIGGEWMVPQMMPNAIGNAKTPGIAADAFGNVALVWSAGGQTWFSSLHPVLVVEAPLNPAGQLTFNPDPTYALTWQANPDNTGDIAQGYNIYKKESTDADFVKLLSVSNSTFTASLTYPEVKIGIQFGLTTSGPGGKESDMVLFPITYPQIYAPVNLKAMINIGSLKGTPEVTYSLSWQSNPQNSDKYVQNYKIYKKEGSGDFELLTTVSNSTFSYTQTFVNPQLKIQFAVSAVSVLGQESAQPIFGAQASGLKSRITTRSVDRHF